ncbi:hypothetical protein [Mycetohabitans sp. B46]|uniref:hypothetical protein n=1 Tax=Mycetohabitans sp. B46 TaxID=2772536 RepID=UPI00307D1D58
MYELALRGAHLLLNVSELMHQAAQDFIPTGGAADRFALIECVNASTKEVNGAIDDALSFIAGLNKRIGATTGSKP